MTFDNVIGQQEAKERLRKLVEENRVPHAMLFTGPRGAGKLALAIAFASYLLNPKDNPNYANAKAMLDNYEHPDLHFTYPTIKLQSMSSDYKPVSDDFAHEWHNLIMKSPYITAAQWIAEIGDDKKRAIITAGESEALIHKLSIKSSQGRYKVSIIWLPELMNLECANKILKLLEEPPQGTVFLMVSEEPEKLLETIRSRTQRFDVKRIADEDICKALIEQRGLSDDDAHRISRIAHGSWNEALQTIDAGNEERQFLDLFETLMRLCYMRKVKDLKRWAEACSALGRDKQRRMIAYFQRQIRENFIYNFHNPELNYQTQQEAGFSRNFSRFINEANVIGINDLFQCAYRDIGQNANAKIVFYDIALKMIVLLLSK
ncbi:MAG: DNA polymerase III subunit delta [Prevotella sp.]|uniref:DNA polymerase III subunit n=1 Tax=Prevotella sp. TaxID=59823 RepID=UPI00258BE950|nr:DNA polymerase III subunit delta [Prevotella sp.]MDD6852713.1 DNA polymerase III subunit delta [Prevotella sp.]